MKNKTELRKIQKRKAVAGNIAMAIIEENLSNFGRFNIAQQMFFLMKAMMLREKARAMAETPAEIWRYDKPEIDIRRFRKWHKNNIFNFKVITSVNTNIV